MQKFRKKFAGKTARRNKLCPLEAKFGDCHRNKSLNLFTKKFSKHILNRYPVYTKALRKDRDITCLPLYLVPFL